MIVRPPYDSSPEGESTRRQSHPPHVWHFGVPGQGVRDVRFNAFRFQGLERKGFRDLLVIRYVLFSSTKIFSTKMAVTDCRLGYERAAGTMRPNGKGLLSSHGAGDGYILVPVNKSTLLEDNRHRNISFQITKSGAGSQFL